MRNEGYKLVYQDGVEPLQVSATFVLKVEPGQRCRGSPSNLSGISLGPAVHRVGPAASHCGFPPLLTIAINDNTAAQASF